MKVQVNYEIMKGEEKKIILDLERKDYSIKLYQDDFKESYEELEIHFSEVYQNYCVDVYLWDCEKIMNSWCYNGIKKEDVKRFIDFKIWMFNNCEIIG